jgi:hypothetical protein
MPASGDTSKLTRPSTPTGIPPPEAHRPVSKLNYGVVCSSNINRSMEAHLVLGNAGTQDRVSVGYKLFVQTTKCFFQFRFRTYGGELWNRNSSAVRFAQSLNKI